MLNLNKQLNQKNFAIKPNKLMRAMLPALCISTFSFGAHAAVENVAFEDDLKDIKISWDAVVDESHAGYNLYRSDTVDGERTLINDAETVIAGTLTRFSYAGAGTTYFYSVDSVDAEGNVLDTSTPTAYALTDTDNDGMSDDWENTYDLDSAINDSALDLDKDGLTNLEEYQYQSDTEQDDIKPNFADTDGDGIHDGFEVAHEGLDPGFEDSDEDVDNDTFTNLEEFIAGSDPTFGNETPDTINDVEELEITITPFADTFTQLANPDATNDTAVNLGIRNKQGELEEIAYIQFSNFGIIPNDATITSAILNVTNAHSKTMSNVIAYDMTDSNPDLTTLTWNNQSALGTALTEATDIGGASIGTFDVSAAINSPSLTTIALWRTTGGTNARTIHSMESGANSPTLDITYASGAVDLPPAKIENLSATAGSATVDLSWNATEDNDVVSYNVYRRSNKNFLFGSAIANVTAGTTTYTDATANTDQYYQYIIKAVDASNESDASSVLEIENVIASGVTLDPKPLVVKNIDASDNVSAIKVSWTKNDDYDLAGYNIYRDNVLLNTDALLKSSSSSYSDYTAAVNSEYTYRVEAIDEAGQTSDESTSISYTLLDSDVDGLSDHFEEKYAGDLYEDGVIWDVSNPTDDADGDGLNNLAEYTAATNPTITDTDEDGIDDNFEVNNGLDPLDDEDAALDADEDTYSNLEEYENNTDINDSNFTPDNPNGLPQFQQTINPIADTYVNDRYPDRSSYTIISEIEGVEDIIVNYNDATSLDLSAASYINEEAQEVSNNIIAFLKFDVSQIDMKEGSPIKSFLRLHRTGNSTNDVAIYKVVDNDWDSATLTWQSKPDHSTLLASDIQLPGNKEDDFLADDALDWDNKDHHEYAEIDVSSVINSGEQVSFAILRLDDLDKARSVDSVESNFAAELVINYTEESMDLDFDGMPDFWERRYGLNPEINDSSLDFDNDGLTNIEEYNLSLEPNNTDTDGDGSLDNVDLEPGVANDFAEPVFDSEIAAIVVDSTGLLTDVTELVLAANITAYDEFDGEDIIATIVEGEEVLLASGQHTILLEAVDNTGYIATKEVAVHVNPQVNLGLDLIGESGSEILIPVSLSGTAANYPVTVDYQVMHNEEVTTGQVTFEEDAISTDLVLMISEEAQDGDTYVISFTDATNAVIDNEAELTVNIANENFVPTVSVSVSQAGSFVSSVAPTAGLVTITANISDINMNDEHSITFEVIDSVFSDDESDDLANTFTFDPVGLDTGYYQVKVTVAETSTGDLHTIEVLTQLHVDASITEIVADSDQDGIPDSVDTSSDVYLLPVAEAELTIAVAADLKLSLGDYAQGNSNASIDAVLLDEDREFDSVSAITNFKVEGLALVGSSVQVVLPLAQGVTIPQGSAYRIFTKAKGWFDFVIDENNSIGSANKDINGLCPAPGSDNYLSADLIEQSGLIAGNDCIQLTIEDGGANDADGVANGIVVDLGVLVMNHVNLAPQLILEDVFAQSNELVTLVASSTDYEGDEVTYSWVQLSGPSVEYSNEGMDAINFTTPKVIEDTTLIFEVVASDGVAESSEMINVYVTGDPTIKDDGDSSGGSFGWLVGLIALAGVARRKIFK